MPPSNLLYLNLLYSSTSISSTYHLIISIPTPSIPPIKTPTPSILPYHSPPLFIPPPSPTPSNRSPAQSQFPLHQARPVAVSNLSVERSGNRPDRISVSYVTHRVSYVTHCACVINDIPYVCHSCGGMTHHVCH